MTKERWARIRREDSFGRRLESVVAHKVLGLSSDRDTWVRPACGMGAAGKLINDPSAKQCKICERL